MDAEVALQQIIAQFGYSFITVHDINKSQDKLKVYMLRQDASAGQSASLNARNWTTDSNQAVVNEAD